MLACWHNCYHNETVNTKLINPMTTDQPFLKRLQKTISQKMFRTCGFAIALACCSFIAGAQTITVSGTVYDDGNGGTIGGSPVSMVNNTQLYVYLLDNTNTVIARSAVAAFAGTYSITANANANYGVALSSSNYLVTSVNPNLGLPSNWVATAEGTTSLGDGTPDFSVAINSSSNLTINFGIDQRPMGNSTSILSVTKDLNGRVLIPYYAFTGSDPEDGTYTAGFSGRDIDLYQATGGTLYYNGTVINFSSANTATRFSAFDYTLLRFQPTPNAITYEFAYSIVDNAGKAELVPNSVTFGVPLPVKLTDFIVKAAGQSNLVAWTIASEKDNAGFEIERSTDGISFTAIGHVAAKGQDQAGSGAASYSYNDYAAATLRSPAVYYRIKQLDVSGTHEYSRIMRVAGINNFDAQLAVFPNPSTGVVSFDIATGNSAADQLTITVVNTTGHAVHTRSVDVAGGRVSTSLDLSALPAGQYYVQVRGAGVSFPTQHVVLMPH